MKRRAELDAIRIIAISLVLFNHMPGYHLYTAGQGLPEVFYLFLTGLTRINVPLFAMVSGALLLGGEDSYSKLFRHRIARIAASAVIFQVLLWGIYCWNDKGQDTLDFICGFFTGGRKRYEPFWFLYCYIGFLFMLPFLRKIARQMTHKDFIYLIVMHFVLTSLPHIVNFLLCINGSEKIAFTKQWDLPLTTAPLFFYPLMGWYLDQKVDVRSIPRRMWLTLGCLFFLSITAAGLMTWTQGKVTGHFTQDYVGDFSYLSTIVAFLALKRLFGCNKVLSSSRLSAVVCAIGGLTFGIYLLDPSLRELLWAPFCKFLHCDKLTLSVLWCLFSMLVCGFATFLLKQIPYVRKTV